MEAPRITRRKALHLGAKIATAAALAPALGRTRLGAQPARGGRRDYDVRDFGAVGDGQTLDSSAIQRAIDSASAAGRGRVIVPGKKRYLIANLELKSGVDLHLGEGSELVISTRKEDYQDAGAVFLADNAVGFQITGSGRIDGRAKEFMTGFDKRDEWWLPKPWRPRLFQIVACRDLEFRDFTFGSAPAWGLHLLGCEQVLVDGIFIRNDLDVPNCDGIGPDHSRGVEIRNCDIVCGDDGIVVKSTRQDADFGPCANIVVKDCKLHTQDSALKIGTETTGEIHNIRMERCEVVSSCRSFNIQLRDEGSVHDIDVRDITFSCRYHSDPWWGRGEAFSITAVPRLPETKLGQVYNVRLRNFTGRSENSARIYGSSQSRPRGIIMENISLTLDRWTKYRGAVFDNRPTKVEEGILEHNTPAFSIMRADDVSLINCEVEWGKKVPDSFTYALEAEDVHNLAITDFSGKAAHPKRDPAIKIV